MSLRSTINNREQTPLSYNELKVALDPHLTSNFVMLDDLKNVSEEKLFAGKDCCLILATMHTADGSATKINHWVSLHKRGDRLVFFDSLGHTIPRLFARLHTDNRAFLDWANGRKIEQNSARVQSFESHINTCGCHQVVRLVHSNMSNQAYVKWLKHGHLKPDESVATMCYLALLK